MAQGDATGLSARRSDPDVARYQNWTLPFPQERAERMVSEIVAMDGPENEEWWMATVCDPESGEVFGDLALNMTQEMRTAEIGYTFDSKHWGNGYAVEALDALVEYLFDALDVTRVFGMLHPDNPASAMVMERCGFLYEGYTKSSFWLDNELSDDLIYGMTRGDWETWRDRPRTRPGTIELVPVTDRNKQDVLELKTHRSQERFVAPTVKSLADAMVPDVVDGAPLAPWLRAIRADDQYVGFVMLALSGDSHPETYLWRFLIDRMHQRRGIGRLALELIEQECANRGEASLLTSWGEGKGSPRPFYERNGYIPTGRIVDSETEARKTLV